jgi:Tfp pilus assembly protein PilO
MRANDRNILLAVPLIAALIAVWFLVLSPKQDQVKTLDAKVVTLQGSVQSQQGAIAGGIRARKHFGRDYHRLVVAGKAVPVEDETASLLVQINRAAGAAHVGFQGISRGTGSGTAASSSSGETSTPTVDASGLETIPYTLTFTGDFFQIADFLSRIDGLVKPKGQRIASDGQLTTVDNITLAEDQDHGFPLLMATIGVTTYLASPSEGAAPGQSGAAPAGTAPSTAPTSTAPTSTASSTDSSSTTGSTATATPTSAPATP